MAPPIPPEILRIVQEQMERLDGAAPKRIAAIIDLARAVVADLEEQLKTLAPGRFTTQQVRTVLAGARAIVDLLGARLGEQLGDEVRTVGEAAAQVGRDGLAEQIQVWAEEHPGAALFKPDLKAAADLLDEGLLEYYESSKQTYGLEAIKAMRAAMAQSALADETIVQAWERMATAVAIPEWRAERIVRTEQSFGMHRQQIRDLEDMFGEGAPEWRKQLVATFDDRTGADSKFVHEQTRELNEPFEDNEGRSYQHPPNRPNDRETMVFVPASA